MLQIYKSKSFKSHVEINKTNDIINFETTDRQELALMCFIKITLQIYKRKFK